MHDFPTHHVPEGETGGVGGDYSGGGVRGNRVWEGIQDTEASVELQQGRTTLLRQRGGGLGLQAGPTAFPISRSGMVRSASVTGRFHSSRTTMCSACTRTHKHTHAHVCLCVFLLEHEVIKIV